MELHRRAVVVLAASVVAACGGGESRWTGSMSDSAGVTVVSNPDVGIWALGEEWALEEELIIGVQEGPPEYQFGSIHRIAVDSRGRILVLDGVAQHIQEYSSDGVYEQTVGARGGGPGELQAAMFLLMGAGDTLLVPDGRTLRFNRYSPDGSSVGSFRMSLEAGRPMMFKTTPSGVIAEQLRPSAIPGRPATEHPRDLIVLLATDGAVTDTLLTFPSGKLIGASGVRVYGAEPAWALTDDLRLVFGVTDEYRISLYAGGQLERVITKPFERRPIDDRERAAIMGEMERRWADPRVSDELRARLRSRFHFADFFPVFWSLAVGPMGTIWVQHVKAASELNKEELAYYHDPRAPEWDVFDSEGRFLGVVTMPSGFAPRVFRGDKIYGDRRDESGLQYVVRLRVVGDLGVGVR